MHAAAGLAKPKRMPTPPAVATVAFFQNVLLEELDTSVLVRFSSDMGPSLPVLRTFLRRLIKNASPTPELCQE